MVIVMGVISFMTVLAVMAFWLGGQALTEAGNTQTKSDAYQVASAGLDAALSKIQTMGGLPAVGQPPMVVTGAVTGGGSYVVTLTPKPFSEVEAVSRGLSRRGAAEIIQTKFFYMNLWEFSVGSGSMTAGGGGVQGTGNVYGPLYVAGSIQLGGGANIEKGPLFVKNGDISLAGDSHLGTPAEKIRLFCEKSYPPDAGDATPKGGHYSYVSSSVPRITLPPLDLVYLTTMYEKAKRQSTDNKMGPDLATTENKEATGGDPATYAALTPPGPRVKAPNASAYYKVIGTTTGPTTAWAGPWPSARTPALVIGGTDSFGKAGYTNQFNTTVHDDFAYVYNVVDGSKTLYVEGTVFVDGDVKFEGGPVKYVGNGTIVANGDIFITCPVYPLNPGWAAMQSNGEALGLVTPGKISIQISPANGNPKDLTPTPEFAGALYGQEQVGFLTNQQVRGSVLTKELYFAANNVHLFMNENLPKYLPESLPGRGMAYIMKGNIARP